MAAPGGYEPAPPGTSFQCSDPKLGRPVDHFTYLNADGEAVVHVDYYNAPKDAPSITGEGFIAAYRTYNTEKACWEHRRGVPKPSIFYRLNDIAAHPELAFLVCANEREADYINGLCAGDPLSEPVLASTWLGGRSPSCDFQPIADRAVLLVASMASLEVMVQLGAAMHRAGLKVSIVDPRHVPGLPADWHPRMVRSLNELWGIMGHAQMLTQAPPAPKTARPVGVISASPLPLVESWREWGFDTNGQNKPYMNTANVKKYLAHHPNDYGDVWLDQYRQQIRHGAWNGYSREWSDADDALLQIKLQTEAGLYVISKNAVRDAVIAHAHEHPVHPYREYRKSLAWDGVERLNEAFIKGWGCPDDEYHRALSRCFFIQQAMRILHPGCKADMMVMFEGKTGIGKTNALACVFGEEHVASPTAQFGTQKFYEEIQGKAVIEIADLHSFKGAALDAIKAGVTRTTDRFRPAYGRYAEDFPRHNVFVGTTESSDWNEDPNLTARRYPPAECSHIDFDYLRLNREQLLAEAWVKAERGDCYWDLPEKIASEKQRARVREDAIDEPVARYLLNCERTTVLEVARMALEISDISKLDVRMQARITQALRKAQWVRKRTATDRWWVPGPGAARSKSQSDIAF